MVQNDEDNPNLCMQYKEVVIDDMTIMIPILTNMKKLDVNTILTVNRNAKVKLAKASSPKRQRTS